jgi:hypothetical protein
MSESLPIIDTCYRLYKQLFSVNAKLTKADYYRLGLGTEQSTLEIIRHLTKAQLAPKTMKRTYLLDAGAELEVLRIKLRLYVDLELANQTRVFQSTAMAGDIGRMLGGWLKSLQ